MDLTLQIDDKVAAELQQLADKQGITITEFIDRTLRNRLDYVTRDRPPPRAPFRQKTYDMGQPKFDLTKALEFAGELEDEAIIEKIRNSELSSSSDAANENC
jgi:hypothetical protein